jgi:thiol:disulfide interchange protein DsbC
MQLKMPRAVTLAVCATLASATSAADAPTAQSIEAAVPGFKVQAVAAVPASPGLYEVISMDGQFLYVDASLKFAIAGEMFDLATRTSVSKENRARLRSVEFDTLPLELAIRRVKGNGSRRMAVFADPDCPYCAKLEETLRAIDNVTIYTFVYPLDELHPQAVERANAIWCAQDRDAAWLGWLLDMKAAPAAPAGCSAPVKRIAGTAAAFGAEGTPSLVFGSGRVAHGALPGEVLVRYLDEPRLQARKESQTTTGKAVGR